MARKRKRAPAMSAAALNLAQGVLAPTSSTSRVGDEQPHTSVSTSKPTSAQAVALEKRDANKDGSTSNGAVPLEPQLEGSEDAEGDSSGLLGIPWALPTEPERVPWAAATDEEEEEDEDEEDEDKDKNVAEDRESAGKDACVSHTTDGLSTLSATESDPTNRWKQHPDRRPKPGSCGGGGGRDGGRGGGSDGNGDRRRLINNSGRRGRGNCRGRSGGRLNGKEGGRGGGAAASGGADAGRDDGDTPEDNGLVGMDGHYGPRVDAPPCTVFAPCEGKVRRVDGSARPAGAALVVGLDACEQLCFVGAARVRCGRGQADVSGHTLVPVPWGPYVDAHSPRWMGLLVIRALEVEEYLDVGACGGGARDARCIEDDADGTESKIEKSINALAEDFAVVVVLRSMSDGPLNFLSAQADADALYFPEPAACAAKSLSARKDNRASQTLEDEDADASTTEKPVPATIGTLGDTPNSQETVSPAILLAAELRLPGMQVVVSEVTGLCPFTVPQDWADAIDAVISAPPCTDGTSRVLVCGAKGVGKSTLCRLLVNRMLGRSPQVAYMDCDLGQPEFTAPGQVSLHLLDAPVLGPPHANFRRPQLAYFVGTTTSKPEPLLYSAAVRSLAERAVAGRQQAASFAGEGPAPPPVVVNTDGWVKGMGEDLLGAVIDAVRPRHIVQIVGTSNARSFELERLPEGCEVHRVGMWSRPPAPAGGPLPPSRPSSQDLRTLRLVAYFLGRGCDDDAKRGTGDSDRAAGGTLLEPAGVVRVGGGRNLHVSLRGGAVYDQEHEIAALLAARRPRRVPWRAIQIRVMSGPVSPSLVLHAINGALVGLVAMPERPWHGRAGAGIGAGSDSAEPNARRELMCLAETPLAPCVGLGIVRSVDVEKRCFYVLTPEPIEVLKEVNVLVRGSLQLPMVMLYDPNWCSHPYFTSEAVGGEVVKSRNYLLRRKQTG